MNAGDFFYAGVLDALEKHAMFTPQAWGNMNGRMPMPVRTMQGTGSAMPPPPRAAVPPPPAAPIVNKLPQGPSAPGAAPGGRSAGTGAPTRGGIGR